jgi:hypothetical protein
MGYRYNLDDRIFGGSMEPRLNPEFGATQLNVKHGPKNFPSPLVRQPAAATASANKATSAAAA